MNFGWINIFNALFITVMLLPNIAYAIKVRNAANPCGSRILTWIEQVGRYASIILMILPIGVWKFGFPSVVSLLTYIALNGLLLVAYLVVWRFYFQKVTMKRALALAIIPTVIFLICGVLLRHWFLVIAAMLFGIGHISVTIKRHR